MIAPFIWNRPDKYGQNAVLLSQVMSPSHRDNDHYIHSSGGFSLSANWFLRLVYPSRQSKIVCTC